jgi:hypothetical protein
VGRFDHDQRGRGERAYERSEVSDMKTAEPGLNTDGVIEAPDRHRRLFGLDPLLAILEETGDRSPPEIKSAVLERLMKHTGARLAGNR